MHITPDIIDLVDQLHNKLGLDDHTINTVYQIVDQFQWEAFQIGFIEGMTNTSYDKDGEQVIGQNGKPLEWWVSESKDKIESYRHMFMSGEEEEQSEI